MELSLPPACVATVKVTGADDWYKNSTCPFVLNGYENSLNFFGVMNAVRLECGNQYGDIDPARTLSP